MRAQKSIGTLYGFTPRSSAAERRLEYRFLSLPTAARARDAHAFLTADPHVAGSPRDRVLAEWVRDRWREYGLEQVEIVEHEVLLPYATRVDVGMVSPTVWRATMKEDAIEGDPFSARDAGLAYHAYSASGDVTASVVYAGNGNPVDYDTLAQQGVDVKGKIVLVRYSVPYSYRGFKALTAEQRGAAGILIYSDPADDGFKKGATYPHGPWGPESHIQRGGIVYDFRVPGDPLTPGWASVPGAPRIRIADAVSLPKIISAPLSWRDARHILDALNGPHHRSRRPRSAGRRRQPSRRVGVRRRRSVERNGVADGTRAIDGNARETGDAPEADDGLRELGRGRVLAHLLDRMGRAVCARTHLPGRRLPQRGQFRLRS